MKNNKKHHGRNNAISVFICSFVDIKTALAWRSIYKVKEIYIRIRFANKCQHHKQYPYHIVEIKWNAVDWNICKYSSRLACSKCSMCVCVARGVYVLWDCMAVYNAKMRVFDVSKIEIKCQNIQPFTIPANKTIWNRTKFPPPDQLNLFEKCSHLMR